MLHKENDYRKICFHCASIYDMEDNDVLICPVCGKRISLSEYEKIMLDVRQAVFGGWTCRVEYENSEEGKRYYTEHCGEILNFVALAIVSGLIGNLSTDVVKKVLNKIGTYLKQNKRNYEDETITGFLESSEKINKFAEYISAYYDEYDGVDIKTKKAILEEVFVDHTSHIIDGLIKRNHKEIDIEKVMEDSPHSREEMMKMVLEIENRVKSDRVKQDDFTDFWDNI